MTVTTAPPRELTLEQYMRDWYPHGWELLASDRTFQYRPEWGMWEAIREIVQNALDEAEAYRWGYDDRGLWISDRGGGVLIRDFMMGAKRQKPEWMRGMYGEGMKIGALAIMREGYQVQIITKEREIWSVMFPVKIQRTPPVYENTIHFLWRENGSRVGTTWRILGYPGPAFEDRVATNLPRKAIIAEGPSQLHEPIRRFNQLIQHEFPVTEKGAGPSRIFARDIYMQDISSPYSYNLWSFPLAPDRHAPKEEYQMWVDVGRLWTCVTKVEHLEVFLQMVKKPALLETDESRRMEMGDWNMGVEPVTGKSYADFVRESASSWKEAWRNVMHPDPLEPPAVIRTEPRLDGMVKHLGYRSVSVLDTVQSTLARAITTDDALVKASQERLREVEIVPDERLDPVPRTHMKLAREITTRVFPYSPPAGVHAAIIPPASDRTRTAGLYSTTTSDVYIAMEQMPRLHYVIDTLVHELAHHRQYQRTKEAEDLTPIHMEAMQYVAAEVVKIAASSELDHLFKEASW